LPRDALDPLGEIPKSFVENRWVNSDTFGFHRDTEGMDRMRCFSVSADITIEW
jgi:hypothetical protein